MAVWSPCRAVPAAVLEEVGGLLHTPLREAVAVHRLRHDVHLRTHPLTVNIVNPTRPYRHPCVKR
eukprot:4434481-Pyramimonas_sp.AAC.1